MTHKHEGKGDCVWCTLTNAMSAHYGPDNPLDLDEAMGDVAAMLVHLIASIDDPNSTPSTPSGNRKPSAINVSVPVGRLPPRCDWSGGGHSRPKSGWHFTA